MLGWLEVWYWVGWMRDVGLVRDGLGNVVNAAQLGPKLALDFWRLTSSTKL